MERAARVERAVRQEGRAAWPTAPASGDGDAPQAPGSIVTVQERPACRQSVAVITVLAAPPR